MSQISVERALGRLLTDEEFRTEFLADPAGAALRAGLELTHSEVEALRRLDPADLARLSSRLDDRICRLGIPHAAAPRETRP